ncbi:unnamed protein product [Closterium sp. NIES-64]|nr:unnamed protein product [Closterium sp. NIES-65]CAI5965624.1 unnamed protein product [Closterium sp. NIES-64]
MAAPSSLLRAGFRSARDALNCGERCRIPVSALQFQAAAGNFFPRTLQQLQQPSECADFSTESGSAAGETALPAHNSVTMPPSFDARAADAAVAAAAASSGAATSDAASSGAAAVTSGTDGSRAVLAKLLNVPRMVLKEELLRSFCNPALTSADVFTVLDDRLHTLHWQMEFKSPEDYSKARELVELYKREGSRIRLQELSPRDHELAFHKKHHNWELRHWRDVSLILTGLPDDVKTDDIEQFFEDYMLHPPAVYHVRIERRGVPTPMRLRMKGETRPIVDLVERRAVVRFANQMEALRALREKHREFVGDRMVELSLLQ